MEERCSQRNRILDVRSATFPLFESAQSEKGALKEGGSGAKLSAIQAEADDIADGLLDKCVESERNMAAISSVIENLRSLSTSLTPARSPELNADWRLVFASDDDALCAIGTGLHKLPLTRMQAREQSKTCEQFPPARRYRPSFHAPALSWTL